MLRRFPAAEQEELAGYFRKYGADPDTAARMAAAVSSDPGTALRIHAREELGVDPDELPSPVLAGGASLLAFSAGALVPLLPYLAGLPVLAVSLALTAVALMSGGMLVGRLTGRPVLRSGLRQLALGGLAVAVTFLVGHLIGGHGALRHVPAQVRHSRVGPGRSEAGRLRMPPVALRAWGAGFRAYCAARAGTRWRRPAIIGAITCNVGRNY